jgi:hypothetical protein
MGTENPTQNPKTPVNEYGVNEEEDRKRLLTYVGIVLSLLMLGALLLVAAMAMDRGAEEGGRAPRIVYDKPSKDDPSNSLMSETKKPAERVVLPSK